VIDSAFLTGENTINILRQVSINGVMAIGMTVVIIGGGIDLSIGSILSLSCVVSVGLQSFMPFGYAISIALFLAIIVGLANGYLISLTKAEQGNAFIITFGMQFIIAGIALLCTQGKTLKGSSVSSYNFIGKGFIGIFPVPVVIFLICAAIFYYILNKTIYGRQLRSIGFNAKASRFAGIKNKKITIVSYMVSGGLAAIAGVILTARTVSATPIAGVDAEFDALTAVIIGGSRMAGGAGGIPQTIVGVLIIGVISNIMNLMGLGTADKIVVKGVILIIAVFLDRKKH
jgi:ribose/xylose/arabinose/galactoside ABC-type transport system permease subunit